MVFVLHTGGSTGIDRLRRGKLRQQLRLYERGQLHRFTGCVWWDGRLLYLCAVRPCQQRIAAAGFPWGVRDSLFLLVSLDQFRAPPGRQGG